MRHLFVLLTLTLALGGTLPAAAGDRNEGVPRFGHVFVLIGEERPRLRRPHAVPYLGDAASVTPLPLVWR